MKGAMVPPGHRGGQNSSVPLSTALTGLCLARANLPELEQGLAPTLPIFNRERPHDCLCEHDSVPHIWALSWRPALP